MTWVWATLLLVLVAPFVLWPLITSAAVAPDDGEEAGPPEPPASDR